MSATKSLLAHTFVLCKLAHRSTDDWSLASTAVQFHAESLNRGCRAYDSDDFSLLMECQKLVREGDSILVSFHNSFVLTAGALQLPRLQYRRAMQNTLRRKRQCSKQASRTTLACRMTSSLPSANG